MDITIPRTETLPNASVAFTVDGAGVRVVLSYECCNWAGRSCGQCSEGIRKEILTIAELKKRVGLPQYEKVCKALFAELLVLREEEGWALRTREGTWWYTGIATKCNASDAAHIFSSIKDAKKIQEKDRYEETNPYHGGWELMRYRRYDLLGPKLKVEWSREEE